MAACILVEVLTKVMDLEAGIPSRFLLLALGEEVIHVTAYVLAVCI